MYVTYIDRFSCHQFDADDNGKLERVLSGFFGCCKTAESAVIFCPLTLAAWPLTHRRPRHSFVYQLKLVISNWSPVDLPNNGLPNGSLPKTQMRHFAKSPVPRMTFYST
jgi:hypothetical protein